MSDADFIIVGAGGTSRNPAASPCYARRPVSNASILVRIDHTVRAEPAHTLEALKGIVEIKR
jgi:hypothetical protein